MLNIRNTQNNQQYINININYCHYFSSYTNITFRKSF